MPAIIPVGCRVANGKAVEVLISLLPRHVAIIAGAGSGKTVLLRRIVEEAALAGVPAIVVDPNNDLSRLGDLWPERPAAFSDEDAAKATRYAATVEVVVWTPDIQAGNPLFLSVLSVLPDFAALGDDLDERAQAVTMAADTLGPLAGARSSLQKGVLADALRAFAARNGDFKAMTALLADLPDGVSEIGNAGKLAGKMADEPKASVATNPLLKASGQCLILAYRFTALTRREPASPLSTFRGLSPTKPSRISSTGCRWRCLAGSMNTRRHVDCCTRSTRRRISFPPAPVRCRRRAACSSSLKRGNTGSA